MQSEKYQRSIARFETVNVLANKEAIDEAKAHCGPDVNIIEAVIDDGWIRDSGPTFVINDNFSSQMPKIAHKQFNTLA